jgi:quercetin dioxygenase-like cupin family protein
MSIIEVSRYQPMTDPDDPDDWRPNSEWSLVIDPGDERGTVRDLSLLFEHMAPGDRIPLHRHPIDETVVLEAGRLEYELGDERRRIEAGAVVFIPRMTPHACTNPGLEPARIHAVFTTEVLAIEYLERNPAPGTEGDRPRPLWRIDLRTGERSGNTPDWA